MKVLMVGVSPKRVGGMWTVAEIYMNSKKYNEKVDLIYIPTSTAGALVTRIFYMLGGCIKTTLALVIRKIDIVHIHMAEKGSTFRKGYIALLAKLLKKKVIIHLHAGPFMAWYETLGTKKQEIIRNIFSISDKVIVLGHYWKSEMVRIIPESKLEVLYNGVDCPLDNKYNLKGRNIVYFGVMNKAKGIYDLISAIREIDKELDSDIKVLLCGKDLEGDIEKKIRENGLEERVKMLGWINKEKRIKIFENAMIDILPSYYEGLSMSVIEAMAYGIPVITTKISTMPELLKDEICMVEPGDYIKLGERILQFSRSKELRKMISENEYKRAKEMFSEHNFIENTLLIYEKLL